MVFKNQKQLESFLMKQSRLALLKAQDRVYSIIKQFVYKFYNDYPPHDVSRSAFVYERTRQLLESLVESRIVSDGKGYKTEIYFDLDKLKYYKQAWQEGNPPSGEQVFEAAKKGLHGAIGDAGGGYEFHYEPGVTGVNIWSDPIQELDAKAIDILVEMLRVEGIPVKRG